VGGAMRADGVVSGKGFPETRPRVEFTLMWGFLGLRTFDLAQAGIALATGSLNKSINPSLDAGLLVVVAVESLLIGLWLFRRRSLRPYSWPAAADFALALVVLASAPAYTSPEARLGVWTMWAYPITLSSAVLAGATIISLGRVAAVSGAIALTYLAVVAFPLASDTSGRATALANAFAYPGFALLIFFLSRFVRNLANAADSARKRVTELEKDRSRALVHDLLVYLRIDRFLEADDQTQAAMAAQAQTKYERMRRYVDGGHSEGDLKACLDDVLQLHPRLPIKTFQVERGVELAEDVREQLERALDTALSNVEQHAASADVIMSIRSDTHYVTVTVSDNGPGFDETATPHGFGISEILGRHLEDIGGWGTVRSSPGTGTDVHITVPRKEP
jgi:signal transduction histidine kinase